MTVTIKASGGCAHWTFASRVIKRARLVFWGLVHSSFLDAGNGYMRWHVRSPGPGGEPDPRRPPAIDRAVLDGQGSGAHRRTSCIHCRPYNPVALAPGRPADAFVGRRWPCQPAVVRAECAQRMRGVLDRGAGPARNSGRFAASLDETARRHFVSYLVDGIATARGVVVGTRRRRTSVRLGRRAGSRAVSSRGTALWR
jgi:hypothetical protein